MRLTTKSEYALLALLYISRHQKKGYVKIEKICKKYNIDKKYLEQLLTHLRQKKIITTQRGAYGGYRLARPANKITLAEIIRFMDGALAPTESVSKYFYSPTPLSNDKKILPIFSDIRNYIAKKLEKVTLQDLI
ncbi:Rrf2 family transcriptional regulator [Patescibacteria group bacterium]|nr:Rrf2 family transcriptional regulator [Patescibacteria group bacterium]MBU0964314.1 Rrf2 family transcriptional regulator [Patescibacteria group bacterium]